MSLQLALPFAPPDAPQAAVPDTALVAPVEPEPRVPSRDVIFEKATRLARSLSADLKQPVRLYVTDNRSTMVSFRRGVSTLHVRIHHMFLDASHEVAKALADYVGRGQLRAGRVIDQYVKQRTGSIRPALPHERHRPLSAVGRCHDLRTYFALLNEKYFAGQVKARIGWGTFPRRRRRRSIRMGVYDHDARTIRIHPALDRPEVPPFFVAYIVFHEMLHQVVPSRSRRGRQVHHSVEFRRRERAYPEYQRAIAWERAHLGLLLRPVPEE